MIAVKTETKNVTQAYAVFRSLGPGTQVEILMLALSYMEHSNTRSRMWCITRATADVMKFHLVEGYVG